MRLNCNKAKKLLKWKSVLKFDEAIEMVANWYSSFYLDPKNIDNIITLVILLTIHLVQFCNLMMVDFSLRLLNLLIKN